MSKAYQHWKITKSYKRSYVATLALGLQPRQRGCKGVGQEQARESHHILSGVSESVRE
jgi:hypothetical protein